MENEKFLFQWENGLRIRHMAHGISFSYFSLFDRVVGLVSTLLTAIVATAIFASFAESENNALITIAGILSILATISSAAHSFLKYGELAEKHNQAYASFGSLRRELETNLIGTDIKTITNEKLQELNNKWSELEKSAPAIPQRIFDKASKIV